MRLRRPGSCARDHRRRTELQLQRRQCRRRLGDGQDDDHLPARHRGGGRGRRGVRSRRAPGALGDRRRTGGRRPQTGPGALRYQPWRQCRPFGAALRHRRRRTDREPARDQRGSAVSLRVGVEPDPWESAADLAVALIPMLAAAPVRTVLNLNVPHLPPEEIRGVRWARVSGAGLIKSARGSGIVGGAEPRGDRGPGRRRGRAFDHGGRARGEGPDRADGGIPVPPLE